jgi:hypothetical protein
VSERQVIFMSALAGAVVGAAAGYLFFTEPGRGVRERMEPFVEDLRHEFARFQRTVQKVGDMAAEGMRVVDEFNAARSQTSFGGNRTPH